MAILMLFAISVLLSAIITLIRYYTKNDNSVLSTPQYGFLHHIRFGLQIVFALVIFGEMLLQQGKRMSLIIKSLIVFFSIVLLAFLVWHQSLTGIFTFIGTAFLAIVIWINKLRNRNVRIVTGIILLIIIIAPFAYIYYAIDRFYPDEEIQFEKLDKHTAKGNLYWHDMDNNILENGNYVGLYICEEELEEEWNKRSDLKYGDRDEFGYHVKYTLFRYLTSKNLRKDAEGINALTDRDIQNIENGISNYIFAEKRLSIYPRVYVSIWEIDTYFKTGISNHRSLAQRIEYTKAAFQIIKNNFWLGVGTGNWKKAYREVYIQNKTQMDPARYGNVHNQYLNYMVKFGIVGLVWILFAIIFPVVTAKAYRNPVFLLFLIIMFIGNFGDANFETHTGSNFFVFFYCLFIVPRSG